MKGKIACAGAILAIGLFFVVPGREATAAPGQATTRDACSDQNCRVLSLSYGLPTYKFPACAVLADGGVPLRYGWAIFDLDAGIQKNCTRAGAWAASGGGSSGGGYWFDGGAGYIYAAEAPRNPDGGYTVIMGGIANQSTTNLLPVLMVGNDNYISGLNMGGGLGIGGVPSSGTLTAMAQLYTSQAASGPMVAGLNICGGGPSWGNMNIAFMGCGAGAGSNATPYAQFANVGGAYGRLDLSAPATGSAIRLKQGSFVDLDAAATVRLSGDGTGVVVSGDRLKTVNDARFTWMNAGITAATANSTTPALAVQVVATLDANDPIFAVCHGAGCTYDLVVPHAAPTRLVQGVTIGEATDNNAAPITYSGRGTFISDGGSVAANADRDETLTQSGPVVGADCRAGMAAAQTAGIATSCFVSTTGVYRWRFSNVTTGAKVPTVTTYSCRCDNP